MRHLAILLTAASILLAGQSQGFAISMYDDVPMAEYEALGAESMFDSVGFINIDGTPLGSGTLLANSNGIANFVLTAAHVALDIDGNPRENLSFGVGTSRATALETVSVTDIYAHPDYVNLGTSPDVALLKLSQPVTAVQPATLFEGSLIEGDLLYSIGYGIPATPSQGFLPGDGVRRGMTNAVFDFGNSIFNVPDDYAVLNFFPQGDFRRLRLGGATTPGDSGGGWFIDVAGDIQLAAVSSYNIGSPGVFADSGGYQVESAMSWINSIITVPEPSSFVLLAFGSVGLLMRRRAA